MRISSIIKYPVKSLPGIQVEHSEVGKFGLSLDRRITLVNSKGDAITQREFPKLALLKCKLEQHHLQVEEASIGTMKIPLHLNGSGTTEVKLWGSHRMGSILNSNLNDFFSTYLGQPVSLVKASDEGKSFADGNPLLVIGEQSMADLNERIGDDLSILRFRPNIVFEGGNPYDEDDWKTITTGGVPMKVIKACLRCILTTVDPKTGVRGKEPLKTLNTYRKAGNNVSFGMYFQPLGAGVMRVGDEITVI